MGTSSLLYNEPPLVVPPSLAVALGLNEAIVCQQLHFWLGNKNVGIERDGYKWIHNTYEQWKENFPFWSERTIQRIFVELEKRGVVVSAQFNSATWDKTKFYRIDYEWLEEIKNTPKSGTGGGTIEDDKLALSEDDKLSSSLKSIDYTENTEDTNYVSAGLENPSPDTPQNSVLPVMEIPTLVSEPEPCNRVMSTAYVEQVVVPEWATLVAEELPSEPTPPAKVKPKKAANPKVAPPPKPPKEPRVLTYDELTLLKRVEAIEPGLYEQVEERIRKYPRSQPWSVAQVYILTGIRVQKTLWPTVASLNGVSFEEEKLLTCYKAWLMRGYNPQSLNWLFDWYKAGGPPKYKSQYGQQAQQQAVPVQTKPKVEFDDPLVIDLAQWVMNMPGYGSKSPNSIRLGMWMAVNNDEMYAFHLTDAPELLAKYLAEKSI